MKIQIISCLLATALLSGCIGADTSHVMVSNARPAIDPSQVQVYLVPPAKFESVALLQGAGYGKGFYGSQARMDVVLTAMKKEAAGMGANGVLLTNVTNNGMDAHSYGANTTVQDSLNKSVSAVAIWVSP